MFFKKLKRIVNRNSENIGYLRDHVHHIEKQLDGTFVDVETGQVYSNKVGVSIPLMEKVYGCSGGGGGLFSSSHTRPFRIVSLRAGRSNPRLERVGGVMFHKDFVPKCDYVMRDGKGGYKFFNKAKVKEVKVPTPPVDVEVNEKGKVIKQKKAKK